MPARRFLEASLSIRNYYLLCQIVLLVILLGQNVHCQQSVAVPRANVSSETPAANPSRNSSDDSELILSADEFVDSREVPLILIDGMANEDSAGAARPASENVALGTSTTASSTTDSSHHLSTNQSTPTASTPAPAATATTTTSTATDRPATEESSEEAAEDDGLDEGALDDDRSSANLAGATPFEPPQNISQYMDYIEKLFHDLRHQITHLFEPHLPQLIRTSQMVELTSSCSYDMLRMALALRQFEPWALRMIDSSGKVPEGIFEGSFTALGSYDECLSTVFQSASSHSSSGWETRDQPPSSEPGAGTTPLADQTPTPTLTTATGGAKQVAAAPGPTQGKYCLVTVSPFMPPKPPADKVERLFQEEANRRNYTRDDQFSRLSPMFYYMKFRIGVCIPSTCDQSDMDSISSALSSSLRLNITIPDCRVKQTNQELTRHQLVGGLTFALVSALVLLATLIDCFKLKWKQLEHQDIEFIQGANKDGHTPHHQYLVLDASGNSGGDRIATAKNKQQETDAVISSTRHEAVKIKIGTDEAQLAALKLIKKPELASRNRVSSGNGGDGEQRGDRFSVGTRARLIERLSKHWTWMSFSLVTNFRLYFQTGPAANPATCHSELGALGTPDSEKSAHQTTVACLNGIRVLSLCWVIVANSYLTLDPRATKRLTKTREAPRDFLFQLVVQASLAIETFFFLSGLLMSISFSRHLRPAESQHGQQAKRRRDADGGAATRRPLYLLKWVQFYVHRYVRITPPTMLVIAFSMYAYHYGDGPLWYEATQKVHQSCTQNWWRHLLHVANFIDTRQMCFIHYWYIAADMQLFLFAPIIMFLLFKSNRSGYCLMAAVGAFSIGSVFYTTYTRSLPPTLLFYSTDPESRREFGNTIMTKPMTHALPYMVGMLVGWLCFASARSTRPTAESDHRDSDSKTNHYDFRGMSGVSPVATNHKTFSALSGVGTRIVSYSVEPVKPNGPSLDPSGIFSATGILGLMALCVFLIELFLPYKWNNSQLPSRFVAALYAALFRLGWSLVLAYVVVSCGHRPGKSCRRSTSRVEHSCAKSGSRSSENRCGGISGVLECPGQELPCGGATGSNSAMRHADSDTSGRQYCYCGSGGNYLNRLLSLGAFSHLSKLSFVAYLIHLPLMSVFIGQTRGLFAFSHTLVIHFAISYLVISFALSFLLVHFIEFPFITFERVLFDRLFRYMRDSSGPEERTKPLPKPNTLEAIKAHEKHLFYEDPRFRTTTRAETPQQSQNRPSVRPDDDHSTATNHLHRTATGGSNQGHLHHQNHVTTERL